MFCAEERKTAHFSECTSKESLPNSWTKSLSVSQTNLKWILRRMKLLNETKIDEFDKTDGIRSTSHCQDKFFTSFVLEMSLNAVMILIYWMLMTLVEFRLSSEKVLNFWICKILFKNIKGSGILRILRDRKKSFHFFNYVKVRISSRSLAHSIREGLENPTPLGT